MTASSTSIGVAMACLAAVAAPGGVHWAVAAQSPSAAVATPHVTSSTSTVATAPQRLTRAAALAAGCTPCHQSQVHDIPALDGQTREVLRAKLAAFRDGTLPGTVMPQLVRGYTPAELDLIAGWFATGGDAR
jgi:cytochrome c553